MIEQVMNFPGIYSDEHPILALWVRGDHHLCASYTWTVHNGPQEGYVLRHTSGFSPPFRTRECERPAATYAGIIERLEAISIPLIAEPKSWMCEAAVIGFMYASVFDQVVSVSWYYPPEEWKPLARWHSETTGIFGRVLQQGEVP
jgi:hypothetical protein